MRKCCSAWCYYPRRPGYCVSAVVRRIGSLAGGALLTSIVFAGAHHIGPMGEPFLWYTFLFRMTAGIFFAALFVYRGFGVAAGTHAMYDVLVGLF